MSHTAEIIAVGTEILLGNIANTDAQMLSLRALSTLGVNVFWHTVVGDNPQRLREALDIARHRADIILTTGGLGPTYDDLTKQTICAAFGQKLVLHEDILEDIRAFISPPSMCPCRKTTPSRRSCRRAAPCSTIRWAPPPGCAFEADGVHADAAGAAPRVRDHAPPVRGAVPPRPLQRGHRLPRYHDLRHGRELCGPAAP